MVPVQKMSAKDIIKRVVYSLFCKLILEFIHKFQGRTYVFAIFSNTNILSYNLHSAGRRNEFDIFTDSVFKHYVNLYYISKWLTYDSNLMPYISNESFLQ